MNGLIRKIFYMLFFIAFLLIILNNNVNANNYEKQLDKATMYIDDPIYMQNIKDKLYLRGWVMSTTPNISINVYIDNKLVDILERNQERPDVLKAILDYGSKDINPIPGFIKSIDISNILDGEHILKIEVKNKYNSKTLTSSQTKIYVKKYNAKVHIDSPTYNENNRYEMLVRGWTMSETKNTIVDLYIDNRLVDVLERNQERPDVLKAILDYGSKDINPIPGFVKTIDISNLMQGSHVLEIRTKNKVTNEVLTRQSTLFYIDKNSAKMYIDSPVYMQDARDNIYIRGWVMSYIENIDIKVYINNNLIDILERNEKRPDVIKAIPGYGGENKNPIPGFNKTIGISNYKSGVNKLTIEIVNKKNNEIISQESVYINIKTRQYYNGIDVSHHQGVIDWKKVKNDNIDFAIIRAGFRGYGESGTLNKDTRFYYNIKNAIANGIDVGVYFFSQATSVQEAIEEANYTLEIIKGYNIKYPVIIDVEYANEAHTGRADNISKEIRTQIVIAFCEKIREAGYTPMFYTDKWFLSENIDINKLKNYKYWLAHYTGATRDNPLLKPSDYKGSYYMWQYTAKGHVDGINGYVDMNIRM